MISGGRNTVANVSLRYYADELIMDRVNGKGCTGQADSAVVASLKPELDKIIKMSQDAMAKMTPARAKAIRFYVGLALSAAQAIPRGNARDSVQAGEFWQKQGNRWRRVRMRITGIPTYAGMSVEQKKGLACMMYRAGRGLDQYNYPIGNRIIKQTMKEYLVFLRTVYIPALLKGGLDRSTKIITIVPPNVIEFAQLGSPKFSAQFIRLYKDLMDRQPEAMRYGADDVADKRRKDVGVDLINKVKGMFGIPRAMTTAQIRNNQTEKDKLNDAAAKRLAATLGHDVKATTSTQRTPPTAPTAPTAPMQPNSRDRGTWLGQSNFSRARREYNRLVRAHRTAMQDYQRRLLAHRQLMSDRNRWPTTQTSTVSVVIEEIERLNPAPRYIRPTDSYAVVDHKRELLNDAYYLRYEKEMLARSSNWRAAPNEADRRKALAYAAYITKRDLVAFIADSARLKRPVKLENVRVIDITLGRNAASGVRGKDVVIAVEFGAVIGLPREIDVVGRRDVADKEMAREAVMRMWRAVLAKAPNAKADPAARSALARNLNRKLHATIDNADKSKYLHPKTGNPDSAVILMATRVTDVKATTPHTVTVELNPPGIIIKTIKGDGSVRVKGMDGVTDAVRYLYDDGVKKAKDEAGRPVAASEALKAAVAQKAGIEARRIYNDAGQGRKGLRALVNSTAQKVVVRKIGTDDAGRPVYKVVKFETVTDPAVCSTCPPCPDDPDNVLRMRGGRFLKHRVNVSGDIGSSNRKIDGKYPVAGYGYGEYQLRYGTKKNQFVFRAAGVGGSWITLTGQRPFAPDVRPVDEQYRLKFRADEITLGYEHNRGWKIGKLKLSVKVGETSTRPHGTESHGEWKNYVYEVSELASGSKMMGAIAEITWTTRGGSTYALKAGGGKHLNLFLDGTQIDTSQGHNITISSNAKIKLHKRVLLEGVLAYQNAGPVTRAGVTRVVMDGDGNPTEVKGDFKDKGSSYYHAALGAKVRVWEQKVKGAPMGVDAFAAVRYGLHMLDAGFQPDKRQNVLVSGGFEYFSRRFKGWAIGSWGRTQDNSDISKVIPGADGVTQSIEIGQYASFDVGAAVAIPTGNKKVNFAVVPRFNYLRNLDTKAARAVFLVGLRLDF